MEAAEAVAKVDQWLREVHAQSPNPVRIDRNAVRRVPEGWFVPYNSVAFLDQGDTWKQIFPPPALTVAVNHSGNRPLTGALTGALVGARHGVAGLPGPWVRQLGKLGLVENMAEDIYLSFARHGIWRESGSERKEWRKRYPAG
ncbi:YrhB domain-containing protein [Amycolatopsis cynarae]|uniref:YrhB domain-containing protein n=1 Tax=Amycolatopsis cynarae TaxID=2995223 RepID=A0ABY7B3I6_9PSEU|nr:YrhB domain-containing protein [Amycolatopsis sp. HUAS 11-8]WAL66880.1 YrhB domain-containing protein [Amycolatopsis sp. HUAS 11-8]